MKSSYLFLLLIFSLLLSFSSGQRCGEQAGGILCPSGLCCSKKGFCGSTKDFCKKPDCQSQCLECGWQVGGDLCPNGLCCSKWGFCGITNDYCKDGCQSQCTHDVPPSPVDPPPGPDDDISDIFPESLFDYVLWEIGYVIPCPDRGFYTYDAFITAAKSFPGFGTTGDTATRKKEIASFFAITSYQPRANFWRYCYAKEVNSSSEDCSASNTWPCVPNKLYYGRGPMRLTGNIDYGKCGNAIGAGLLHNPDLVTNDPVIAFQSAIWVWMTPQSPKPSCHDVISGEWQPSPEDVAAGRLPGYGVITNIINGETECGLGPDHKPAHHAPYDRTGFYKMYCDRLKVDPGENIDCNNQKPFATDSFFLNSAI